MTWGVFFFETGVEDNILSTNILFDWLGVPVADIEMLSATLEILQVSLIWLFDISISLILLILKFGVVSIGVSDTFSVSFV